jgi:hypothetical protein
MHGARWRRRKRQCRFRLRRGRANLPRAPRILRRADCYGLGPGWPPPVHRRLGRRRPGRAWLPLGERVQEGARRLDRELVGEREHVLVAGDEHSSHLLGEREQVVVAGIGGAAGGLYRVGA